MRKRIIIMCCPHCHSKNTKKNGHTSCSNGKPLANLVMAIASYTDAKSTVEYSLSPLYNYQYSSIGKLFERLLDSFKGAPCLFSKEVQTFINSYILLTVKKLNRLF